MSGEDQLTVPCPRCRGAHRYALDVRRSVSFGYIHLAGGDNPAPSKKSFTRLFTCPVTNEDFQAQFSMTETENMSIRDVTIKGPAGGDEQ